MFNRTPALKYKQTIQPGVWFKPRPMQGWAVTPYGPLQVVRMVEDSPSPEDCLYELTNEQGWICKCRAWWLREHYMRVVQLD